MAWFVRSRQLCSKSAKKHVSTWYSYDHSTALWTGPSDCGAGYLQKWGTVTCKTNAFRKRVRSVINVVNWRKCEWVVNYLKSAAQWSEVKWSEVKWSEVKWSEMKRSEEKWSVVQWRGVNLGLTWRIFMVGEVTWTEGPVKICVLYLWSNNIRN
jgi:hypothetical protein